MLGDRGLAIDIIIWIFTVPAILIVLLRFICRFYLRPSAGLDDAAIAVALVVDIVYSCVTSYAVSLGNGSHIGSIQPAPAAPINAIKWNVIANALALYTFAIPKIAIALLLGRILGFGTTNIRQRLLLYGPAVVLMLWSVASCTLWLKQCTPRAAIWDKSIPSKCIDPMKIVDNAIVYSTYSAFLDFAYGVYPMLFIAKLQMSFRKKVHISLMLGLCIIGGASAIYKIAQIPRLGSPNVDVTYHTAPILYCVAMEANTIIIAACVPTIGPIVRLIKPSFGSTDEDRAPQGPRKDTPYFTLGTPTVFKNKNGNALTGSPFSLPQKRQEHFSVGGGQEDEEQLRRQLSTRKGSTPGSHSTRSAEFASTNAIVAVPQRSRSTKRPTAAAAHLRELELRRSSMRHSGPSLPAQAGQSVKEEHELNEYGEYPRRHVSVYGHHEGHKGGGKVLVQ